MIPTIVHPGELSSATIQSIQQELKEAGYDPGPVDGRWGPRTKVAYDNFLGGGRRRIVPRRKASGFFVQPLTMRSGPNMSASLRIVRCWTNTCSASKH